MSYKKWGVLLVPVLIGVGVVVWRQQHPPAIDVWVVTVEKGDVDATVANTRAGTVKACRRSKLTMPTGGVVDRLLVKEGDKVEQGQLLLELWNRDRAADVTQAEETLKSSIFERESACLMADLRTREAARISQLAKGNLASEEQIDAARTVAQTQKRTCEAARNQAAVAQARLDFQQAIFERTQLRAPFAGIVADINGEVGEFITPSPPGILTPAAVDLIDYSCLYVTAPIDEVDASSLIVGQVARVTLDAFRGQALEGKLTRIAPYVLDLEKQARTVEVDVQLVAVPESIQLLVGYSADVTLILQQQKNVLRLPTEAILPDNSVWVVDTDMRLHKRQLQVGVGNWSWTEIINGVELGERVVRNPDKAELIEGLSVRMIDD